MFNKLKGWLTGDADWKAEQELNRLGKKDAFLKDAMDGYRAMPEADHTQAVRDLKGKLRQQYTKEDRGAGMLFSWKNIAAAAALIGAIGLFFWTQQSLDDPTTIVEAQTLEKEMSSTAETQAFPKEEISKPQEEPATTAAAPRDNPPVVDPSNIEAGIIDEADLEDEAKLVSAPKAKSDILIETQPGAVQATTPPVTEDVAANTARPTRQIDDKISPAVESDAEVLEPTSPSEARIVIAAKDSEKSLEKVLNGRVKDLENNEGLVGASIYIEGTGEGTITDVDGNFSLKSKTDLPWTVISSYTGYLDEILQVDSVFQDYEFLMSNEAIALDEVVVTGYGLETKKKRSRTQLEGSRAADLPQAKKEAADQPRPIVGFKKMKRYIRRNLKYPDLAKDHKIQGGVTVRFFINEDGEPEQFSILNGLGSGCNQEAERLLKEGPKWEPINTWAIYTVVFSL